MPGCDDFDPIAPNEKKARAWRFAAPNRAYLPPGVTLSGTPVVTVTDAANVDSNPVQILGTPIVGNYTDPVTGVADPANTAVIIEFQNKGVDGADYLFEVTCARSDGDIAEAWNHMRCEAPA
jgi:hypothetical protein